MSNEEKKPTTSPPEETRPVDKDEKDAREKAKTAVLWVQGFNPFGITEHMQSSTLIMGEVASLVNAYQRLPLGMLDELPMEDVSRIRNLAEKARRVLGHVSDSPRELEEIARSGRGRTVDLSKSTDSIGKLWEESLPVIQEYASQATAKRLDALAAALDAKKGEAEDAVEAIRKAAGEAGVSQQAVAFRQEAESHRRAALFWGMGVAALSAYFLLFVLTGDALWFKPDVEEGKSDLMTRFALVQSVADRVLVVGVFSFGLFFCVKNFMAHRHNAVVNRHRQNALETYTALVEATEDTGSRAAILQHAARSIFGAQDSGYVRGGNSGGDEISVNANARFPNTKADD